MYTSSGRGASRFGSSGLGCESSSLSDTASGTVSKGMGGRAASLCSVAVLSVSSAIAGSGMEAAVSFSDSVLR